MNKDFLSTPNNSKTSNFEEMPREKLIKRGAAALTNSELIAILLRTGSKSGGSVFDISKIIISSANNSLAKLFTFSLNDLIKIKGIGLAKAITLFAAFELSHRLIEEQQKELSDKFTSPENVFKYYQNRIGLLSIEEFRIILLNNANRIIKDFIVSKGILNASVVHPREVFREAIIENAASIILIHNHPSGECTPSNEDKNITNQICKSGLIIGIKVLDHIILSKNSYYSFKENNLI